MSALTELGEAIHHYWQLPHHHNPQLSKKLEAVQSWQRNRLRATHTSLFNQPKNKAMADYFLNKLYGGPAFEPLIRQLERIVPKAQKVERFAPASAIEAGALTVQSTIKATELDLHLAQWLQQNELEVTQENMLKAYQGVAEADERRAQNQSLKEVCYRIDKYVKSFMIQKSFKLVKGMAYKHNLKELYDFMADGFAAMKPLKSVAGFIEPFCEREYAIIELVHDPSNNNTMKDF